MRKGSSQSSPSRLPLLILLGLILMSMTLGVHLYFSVSREMNAKYEQMEKMFAEIMAKSASKDDSRQLREMISVLNEQIPKLRADVSTANVYQKSSEEKVTIFQSTLEEIKQATAYLTADFDKLRDDVMLEANSIESKLESKIDTKMDAKFDKKISPLDSRLDAQLGELDEKFERKIDEIYQQFAEQIGQIKGHIVDVREQLEHSEARRKNQIEITEVTPPANFREVPQKNLPVDETLESIDTDFKIIHDNTAEQKLSSKPSVSHDRVPTKSGRTSSKPDFGVAAGYSDEDNSGEDKYTKKLADHVDKERKKDLDEQENYVAVAEVSQDRGDFKVKHVGEEDDVIMEEKDLEDDVVKGEEKDLVDSQGNIVGEEDDVKGEEKDLVDSQGNFVGEEDDVIKEEKDLEEDDVVKGEEKDLIDSQGNYVGEEDGVTKEGDVRQEEEDLVDSKGNFVGEEDDVIKDLVDSQGNFVGEEDGVAKEDGVGQEEEKDLVDSKGNFVGEEDDVIKEEKDLVDSQGNFVGEENDVTKEDGAGQGEEKDLVDSEGNFVGEEDDVIKGDGKDLVVDSEGNFLDEEDDMALREGAGPDEKDIINEEEKDIIDEEGNLVGNDDDEKPINNQDDEEQECDIIPDIKEEKFMTVGCQDVEGISQCRTLVVEAIFIASFLNRTVILPQLQKDENSPPSPFGDLFDVPFINNKLCGFARVVEADYILVTGLVLDVPFNAQSPVTRILKSLDLPQFRQARFLSYGSSNGGIRFQSEEETNRYHKIASSLRGSPELYMIATKVDQEIRTLESNGQFACLHLRIDREWHEFYKMNKYPSDHLDINVIAKKIKNSEIPSEITALYVAGSDLTEPYLSTLREVFVHVFTKSDFAPEFPLLRTPSDARDSTLAILDFEICRQADVFIGNHHSFWAKNLAQLMILEEKPTWQYSSTEKLRPMCDKDYFPEKCDTILREWKATQH